MTPETDANRSVSKDASGDSTENPAESPPKITGAVESDAKPADSPKPKPRKKPAARRKPAAKTAKAETAPSTEAAKKTPTRKTPARKTTAAKPKSPKMAKKTGTTGSRRKTTAKKAEKSEISAPIAAEATAPAPTDTAKPASPPETAFEASKPETPKPAKSASRKPAARKPKKPRKSPKTTPEEPAPPSPAQSEPPKPAAIETKLKPAPQWIDAPPLSPYRAVLRQLHRLVFDRDGDRLDRASTATETPLRDLHTLGDERSQAHDYRPTPRRLVAWVLDCIEEKVPGSLENTTFLDIGSGRGRVLFEAARRPFHRVVGIEFAEELHEDAALNLRHWPRAPMRCRDIDLIHGDALETLLPEGDLVVWMFDPFGERLMTRMAARLAEHSRRWRVTLVLVEPRSPMAFRESPTFREIEPPKEIRRRIALLSPYAVRIFTAGPR
jgi:16S rRNA G966 N2-methylase RsmD